MESFNAIPVFVAVAQNQGFSAAARQLNISKSAVSKRISQLEAQLGVQLLHRSTRKLSLTEAGERFYSHALQATQAARQAEDAVAELQGEPRGQLRIQAPMSFGRLHIAPLIADFLQQYPKVEIDLILDDKPLNIIEQGFDLAIRTGKLPDSSLIARKLVQLRSVICMTPDYSCNTDLHSPQDLATENCLLYSYSAHASQWQFNRAAQQLQVKVTGNYRVNNSEALQAAVLKGAGIARLPTFAVGEDIRQGRLIRLFSDYSMPAQDMYAVFPERSYLPAKVRAFLDFTSEYLGADKPYWDDSIY